MHGSLHLKTDRKIKTFEEALECLEQDRRQGLKIVQCHGVFDLLHPGHIRHFQEAKSQGDRLVVTVTPDRFVNKGPGRPAFTETLRLETLASLEVIDYVILNDGPDAISTIQKIRPQLYIKGVEYRNHEEDVTGKISEEARAVEAVGGMIYYTDDIVFSSSSLLNQYFDPVSPEVTLFLKELKGHHSLDSIFKMVQDLSHLKVLVIGDAIMDEYQYVTPLGQSGKGSHMVAQCLDKDLFLGGSLIIANHVAQFAGEVSLVTALGKMCPYQSFIVQHLDPKIQRQFVYLDEAMTLTKKRYVLKDGPTLTKLFETYSKHQESLNSFQTDQAMAFLRNTSPSYDLVLVCDFGNGFFNHHLIEALGDMENFLALNTQINSGNRGYNVMTKHRRADYISVNEPELRLAAHDANSSVDGLAADLCQLMQAEIISVTQGVRGVYCYSLQDGSLQIPALSTKSVDRIGAGDSYLALSSLCLAKKYPFRIAAFLGSAAAAMSIQMVGNQEPIKKSQLLKFITRLMK